MITNLFNSLSWIYYGSEEKKKIDSPVEKIEKTAKANEALKTEPSYFENVGKIWTIAKVTIPSDVYSQLAALIAMNCVLPAATATLIYYINNWDDGTEENELPYKSALTVLTALLSEQIRVNYNRHKGKEFRNAITMYMYEHLYGTNHGDAAIRMNTFIPELRSDVLKKMPRYIDEAAPPSIGYTLGSTGNLFEIACTTGTLYDQSKNYWTPTLSFLSCATAAMIIRSLSLMTSKTKKEDKKNEQKQGEISPILQETQNMSVITPGSALLVKLIEERRAIDLREAFEQCRHVSARDIVLEMTKHIVSVSNTFLMGSENTDMINKCSLQGATMLGAFRRMAGFIFEDKQNFSDGLEGMLHFIHGIKKFEEFTLSRNKNFKIEYGQTLSEDLLLSLTHCKFVAYDKEKKLEEFLVGHDSGSFMEKYEAALQQQDLLRIEDGRLDLQKGKIYKLSGASNAGKSSFIKALEGYWPMISGNLSFSCSSDEVSIIHGGVLDVVEKCSFIDLLLYPRFFAKKKGDGNGINLKTPEGKQIAERLLHLLTVFNLADKLPKDSMGHPVIEHGNEGYWKELSAGEANRTVIIRMLMSEVLPKILILDEVISNVDKQLERTIFRTLKDELGSEAAIVYVKHEDDKNAQIDEVYYDEVIHFNLEEKQFQTVSKEVYLAQSAKTTSESEDVG